MGTYASWFRLRDLAAGDRQDARSKFVIEGRS